MTTFGVPTLLSHTRMSMATSQLRRQAEAARSEVVTGRKSDLTKTLGYAAGNAHLLKMAIENVGNFRNAIARADLRMSAAQSVLGEIRSGATGLNADLVAALGRQDSVALANSAVIAENELRTVVSRLNTQIEGQSIFAGDSADRPAIADADLLLGDIAALYSSAINSAQFEASLDLYFDDPAGGFQTRMYLGGAGNLSGIEVDSGTIVNGTAKADAPPIKDLLRGYAVIAVVADQAASIDRDSALRAASGKLFSASDTLVQTTTRIGLEQQGIRKTADNFDAEEPALIAAYNALTAKDPYDAASFLQSLEAQIDAAYVVTSRMSQLSLTNYLR